MVFQNILLLNIRTTGQFSAKKNQNCWKLAHFQFSKVINLKDVPLLLSCSAIGLRYGIFWHTLYNAFTWQLPYNAEYANILSHFFPAVGSDTYIGILWHVSFVVWQSLIWSWQNFRYLEWQNVLDECQAVLCKYAHKLQLWCKGFCFGCGKFALFVINILNV